MSKDKFSDKFKEGVSVEEIEQFARKHTTEVFAAIALIIGAISSAFDFFTGPALTILFLILGAVISVFSPAPVERLLKQLYGFTVKQDKTTEMIIGGVKVVIAIFVPFIYFGLLGLLAGTSFHYYIRHAQIMSENKPHRHARHTVGDEHD